VSNFFAFSSGTSSSPTEQVTSTDNGSNAGNQTLTLTNDVTGPTVPAPTVTAGYYTSLRSASRSAPSRTTAAGRA
jgi:hypothetical protein